MEQTQFIGDGFTYSRRSQRQHLQWLGLGAKFLFHPCMISVIIPTYNRDTKIAGAIESVLAQTGVQIQLIVVDDGSTDGTREVVSRYPQVEYYWQENRRQGAARNHGLRHARGQFIASLDSDDRWDPDFLSTSLDCLNAHGTDFAFSNYRLVTNGKVMQEHFFSGLPYQVSLNAGDSDSVVLSVDQTRHLFVRHNPSVSSSLLMRRNVIDRGWDEGARICDDWFLVLDAVLEHNARATALFRPLWTKHLGIDNICDGYRDGYELALKEIEDHGRLLDRYSTLMARDEKAEIRRRTARAQSDAAYHAAHSGRLQDALGHQLSAVRLVPTLDQMIRFFKLPLATLYRRYRLR